jgi:hypothetical protein
MTGGGSVTFLPEVHWASFLLVGAWPPSATILFSNILVAFCSFYVLTGQFVHRNKAISVLSFLVLYGAGLFSNGASQNISLGEAGPLLRAVVFAIPGQVVAAYLLFLVFGYRRSNDDTP